MSKTFTVFRILGRKGTAFTCAALLFSGLELVAVPEALAQTDTLKVMNYNLTNYGNYTSFCTASNNSPNTKDPNIEKVIGYFQPHIFGVNEIGANALLVDRLKALVLNVNGRTWYEGVLGKNLTNSDISNAFFWDTRKVGLAQHWGVPAPTRTIDIFKIYHKPVQDNDTVFVHVIVGHLKAGTGTANEQGRLNMVAAVRTYLSANLPTLSRAIFMGDLNTYSSGEPAYQSLVNPTSGLAFRDPINRPGNWSANSSFASLHTQSPRTQSNGCLSGGGLDDRFDQILMSDALLNATGTARRMYYATGTYKAIGQDGNHFNRDITSGTNSAVPVAIAQALFNASDHLPITAKLVVDGLTANRTALWPSSLDLYFSGPQHLRIVNSNAANPVIGLEVYSLDGRLLETVETLPTSNQTVRLAHAAGAKQILLVRVRTAQTTYTKRLLVPRG